MEVSIEECLKIIYHMVKERKHFKMEMFMMDNFLMDLEMEMDSLYKIFRLNYNDGD